MIGQCRQRVLIGGVGRFGPCGRVRRRRGQVEQLIQRHIDSDPVDVCVAVVVEQDVAGRQRAVTEVGSMGGVERRCNLFDQSGHDLSACRTLREHRRQGTTAESARHETRQPRLTPEVEDRRDVRMLQPSDTLDETVERTDEAGQVGDVGTELTQCDVAIDPRLDGPVHQAVTSTTDLFDQVIAPEAPTRRRRLSNRGVVGGDPFFQGQQLRCRLEPDLAHDPSVACHLTESFGLPARPVQGQDERDPALPAVRLVLDEAGQVGQCAIVFACVDEGCETHLVRLHPQFVEPERLTVRPLLRRELGIGVPAPQCQCGAQPLGNLLHIVVSQVASGNVDGHLEHTGIDVRCSEDQPVAGMSGDDRDARAVVFDDAPQPGDIAPQCGRRGI